MKIKSAIAYLAVFLIAVLSGCSAKDFDEPDNGNWIIEQGSGNEYREITENPFILTSIENVSAFSMDVNTAAYSNIRRYINEGRTIDKNQVRIEEMVNYFSYNYPEPQEGKPFSVSGKIFPCPWNEEAKLLTVGLKAEEIDIESQQNNLVFLLDVSGSMNRPDKLGLMQAAFKILTENLNETDRVSIVTYAGNDKVLLNGAYGNEKLKIQGIIEQLQAAGSTAGSRGILTAYEICEEYFIEGGNNRVILATDGDFNLGVTTEGGLEELISQKRESGIFLNVLGFGYGNLKDNKLETLANCGNGKYDYIDSAIEARKILADQIGGTLITVAKDVKAQVTFNPAKIYSYRLLGYENKLLSNEDWENPEKDAGEIGSGHTVTAVYEIVLTGGGGDTDAFDGHVKISVKYKEPVGTGSGELTEYLGHDNILEEADADGNFISCVVEAALVMRNSVYKGNSSIGNVISRLEGIENLDLDIYKAEFLSLMVKYNR